MSEETAKRIATALELIASRLFIIMTAAAVIAGQMLAFNFTRPH